MKQCECLIEDLLTRGCRCGAMDEEREQAETDEAARPVGSEGA